LSLATQLLQPIRAMRLRYVPLLMVYFAYGATGVVDISRDLWVKESLSLSPAELAGIGVWFTLPWTIKMVFGELVDTVPILRSLLGHPAIEVVGIVTPPDRPAGRRGTTTPVPVAVEALRYGLPLLQPERVRAPETAAAFRSPDNS